MAFEKGRAKTGGRKAGTRNKVNMFNKFISIVDNIIKLEINIEFS